MTVVVDRSLLAGEELGEVQEFLLRESFLQALGHGALRLRRLFPDAGLLQDVLASLLIGEC
jgi:hypothetical protein